MSCSKSSEWSNFNSVVKVVRLGIDIEESFKAIVEISRRLAVAITEEISTVLGGLLTLGGGIFGAFVDGGRGALAGACAGAKLAEELCTADNIVSLADYLMNMLPAGCKEKLVKFFKCFLMPFKCIDEAVKKISDSPQKVQDFINLIQKFFSQNNIQYQIANY